RAGVKPGCARKSLSRVAFAGAGRPRQTAGVKTVLLVLLAVLALTAIAVVVGRRLGGRHQRAVGGVLDAADALEARLRTARAEIEAVAGDDQADPVAAALREMLRQRLWLQEHGASASVA